MSTELLFILAVYVFILLVIGIVLTIREFMIDIKSHQPQEKAIGDSKNATRVSRKRK